MGDGGLAVASGSSSSRLSESGTLCHGDGGHEEGDSLQGALMLPMLRHQIYMGHPGLGFRKRAFLVAFA
jgi:hypothetical protein